MIKVDEGGEPVGIDKPTVDIGEIGAVVEIAQAKIIEVDGDRGGGDDVANCFCGGEGLIRDRL